MPIVSVSKDSEFGFWNDYIRNTNITDGLMKLVLNPTGGEGLLEHKFYRCVAIWLRVLAHSFSPYFISHLFAVFTVPSCLNKLVLSFWCPRSSFVCVAYTDPMLSCEMLALAMGVCTFLRTKLTPITFKGCECGSAFKTMAFLDVGRWPTGVQIALSRAIIRSLLSATKGVEVLLAVEAYLRLLGPLRSRTHISNYNRTMRGSQGVLQQALL